MSFSYEQINCQNPLELSFINRKYLIIKAIFNNTDTNLTKIKQKAWELAQAVNPRQANDATQPREKERIILDALGGVLAEEAWFYYINRIYGEGTVSFTPFNGANGQIDLLLNNGKSIEIRSSFPRNGVKFAICNERYNFKNICKYDNLYKPDEKDKDFFGCVLFQTPKEQLTNGNKIVLYLIGGSTKQMMLDDKISFQDNLVAEGDLTKIRTNYKVIYLKDALDMNGFEKYMASMGYRKTQNPRLNQLF